MIIQQQLRNNQSPRMKQQTQFNQKSFKNENLPSFLDVNPNSQLVAEFQKRKDKLDREITRRREEIRITIAIRFEYESTKIVGFENHLNDLLLLDEQKYEQLLSDLENEFRDK